MTLPPFVALLPTRSRTRLAFAALGLSLASLSCGGGGGGGGGGTVPGAPAGLSYAQPSATYEAEVPIAPNQPSSTGGAIDTYTVLPSLPAGIALDASTGVISGAARTTVARIVAGLPTRETCTRGGLPSGSTSARPVSVSSVVIGVPTLCGETSVTAGGRGST